MPSSSPNPDDPSHLLKLDNGYILKEKDLMQDHTRIRVLLTVPHLYSAAAPYRDMLAIAKYLPRDEFELAICSSGEKGYSKTKEKMRQLGRECMVARFRPTRRSLREYLSSFQAQRLIERHGPFHIQHSIMGTSSPYEAVIGKIKSRLHIHSQIDMTDGGQPLLFRIKLQLANKIIAVSESVKKYLLSRGISPSKVKTVYNGLDLEDIDGRLAKRHLRTQGLILCAGLIVRRKRQEDAIKALAILSKEIPNARLWIAGRVVETDYFEELKRLVHELGLTDKVEFLGIREDLLELMQRANVLVHCADSEGLPWVILEAMAVGLPVVASSIEPTLEMIDHGRSGLVASLGDPASYADLLSQLLTQPDLSKRLGENARSIVEQKFSAKAMVEQIASVYRELVA